MIHCEEHITHYMDNEGIYHEGHYILSAILKMVCPVKANSLYIAWALTKIWKYGPF